MQGTCIKNSEKSILCLTMIDFIVKLYKISYKFYFLQFIVFHRLLRVHAILSVTQSLVLTNSSNPV